MPGVFFPVCQEFSFLTSSIIVQYYLDGRKMKFKLFRWGPRGSSTGPMTFSKRLRSSSLFCIIEPPPDLIFNRDSMTKCRILAAQHHQYNIAEQHLRYNAIPAYTVLPTYTVSQCFNGVKLNAIVSITTVIQTRL